MSYRLKRSKPLGGNKKNTKSGSVESRKKLPTAPDSAGIVDFLYVDRARISALYAQLIPEGVLQTVKSVSQESSSSGISGGTDIKVIKADGKSTDSGVEGIEHLFDASWSIPIEVLQLLRQQDLIKDSTATAGLGAIILSDCFLRAIDFACMDELWNPILELYKSQNVQKEFLDSNASRSIAEIFKNMPKAIHAHFLSNDAAMWATLSRENLITNSVDLSLKYGGTISGSWKVLYTLDAWSDGGLEPNTEIWSAGELMDATLKSIYGMRMLLGRPAGWLGITPLLVYRDVKGWLPS